MTTTLIDVPAGLNGVVAATTTIGDVDGAAGRFHYRGHDATELARRHSFEEVWCLVAEGALPDAAGRAAFRAATAAERRLPAGISPLLDGPGAAGGATLGRIRAALSLAADELGLRPFVDLDDSARRRQARQVCAVMPTIVAALHRAGRGASLTELRADAAACADPALEPVQSYLRLVTGRRPSSEAVRALESYLILTIDHGFNASTFVARVVASTGADLADIVGAGLGALHGPLHGGAPSRALDALDAIGDPAGTAAWVAAEVAAGRRIMGFGHAVYRSHDPRSAVLREVAEQLGGELVERAIDVERRILAALRGLKPDRPLPSNVEYFAGVVMAGAGLDRELFTPTFAVSRTIGWCAHAVEQAAAGKLIRPSSRYVGLPTVDVTPSEARRMRNS